MFCDFRRGWFGRLGLADKATIEFGMKMTNWLLWIISLKPKTSTSNDVHLSWTKNLLDLRSLQKFHLAKWVSEWSTLWDKYLAAPPGINSRHNATFRNSLSHMYTIFLGKSCQNCGWSKGVGIGWCRHGGSFVYWKIWLLKPLWAQGGQRRKPVSTFLVHKRFSTFQGWEILTNRRHIAPTYKT